MNSAGGRRLGLGPRAGRHFRPLQLFAPASHSLGFAPRYLLEKGLSMSRKTQGGDGLGVLPSTEPPRGVGNRVDIGETYLLATC